MSRPFSRVFSLRSPDDENLSPEGASQLQLHRLLTMLGAVLILFFRFVYTAAHPDAAGPAWGYFGMVGLFVGWFVASYGSQYVRRHYVTGVWGLLYLAMGWAVTTATLNHFAADYGIGLLFTYAALGAVVGLGARSIGPVLGFLGYGFALATTGFVVGTSSQIDPLLLLGGMATVALAETIALQWHLSIQKALRRREERLRTVTENIPDAIYRSSPHEGLVYANQAFAEMLGFESVEEILQIDDPSVLYANPEDRVQLRQVAQEEGSFDAHEVELRRKDGTVFPALLSGTLVRDEEGEVAYYDGAVTDITVQKRRQRKAQRRADAMEAASDGIAILDSDGIYTYVNQAHAEIYGYEKDAFIGASWHMCYDEAELQRFEEEIMPTLFEEGAWRGEATGRRADGRSFPQYLTLTILEEGGIVCVVRDITQQKRAERALREERDRFETFFQNLPTAAAHGRLDDEGHVRIRAVNEAFEDVFGVEAGAVEGADIDDLLVPAGKKEEANRINRRVLEAGTLRTEVRRMTADGPRDFRLQVAVRGREAGPPEAYAVYTDITERKRRERQLREHERQLEQIRENVTDVVWMSSPDKDTMEFISKAYEDVWGRSTQELKERPDAFVDAIHPEDRERVQGALEAQRTNPDAYGETYRVVHPDGEVRWVHDRSAGVYTEDGQLERVVGVATDITERKARQQELQDRQEKIESLYSATNHLLTAESREAVADRVHDVLQDVFHYVFNTIRLADGEVLLSEDRSQGDGAPTLGASVGGIEDGGVGGRAYRSGETVVVEDTRTLNGRLDYGDLRSVASVPLGDHGVITVGRGEDGGFDPFDLRLLEILAAHTTVVLDGLERMRALEESEQRFRGIFENAAIGIGVLDDEGVLLDANPALGEMTGFAPEELRGRHFSQFTHPDDAEADQEYYEELVSGERDRYQMEKRYVQKDGEVFWGRLTVSRHEGERVIGMVEDIDDQKRYQEQLREAKEEAERMNQLKSAFLANMSHEIRTPLTSIIGFAEAIGDEVEAQEAAGAERGDGTLARFAHLIKEGGQRLMETLDAVLNLSKLEAGEMDLTVTPIDFVAMAEETVALFEQQLDEAGLALRVEVETSPVWGCADEGGLQIALRNLLSNAIKYTEEGTVWVRVRAEEEKAVLEVEDTGVGMDPEQVSELFEAFKQESEGVSRQYEGSGLGLAVTKRVVEQMDGSIAVETEKGEGTCFTIRLPLREDEPE